MHKKAGVLPGSHVNNRARLNDYYFCPRRQRHGSFSRTPGLTQRLFKDLSESPETAIKD
jgi:hypothetical protein